jgi:electron transport complex protein RnfG
MYRAMVGVGLLCGLLIVGVFLWTFPVIQRNRAEALERAIFRVLPEARSSRTFRLTDAGRFERATEAAAQGAVVYAGYDEAQRLVGIAVDARGMGYQDVIHVLYGYAFARDAIIGLQVLESRETPGLGDKIETDPAFLANFEQLDVRLVADGFEIAHPIEAVKPGKKEHPWQVDGITGATISSTAIADILRKSTSSWIPTIRRNLDDLRFDDAGEGE